MRARKLIAGFIMLMIVFSAFPDIESQEISLVNVHVLIDFGDGDIHWVYVGMLENYTAILATEGACDLLNLELETVWYSFGVFVKGIGGLQNPDDWSWWWSLWIWNSESGEWEASMEGASDLILSHGDNIAWSPSISKPVAAPGNRYPWGQFQRDTQNAGQNRLSTNEPPYVPEIYGHPYLNSVRWLFDTGTIEMPSSPVVGGGRVIVNNWGGVFCLSKEGDLLWRNEDVVGSFTPAIGSGKVLVGGKDGFLYCLNITNGEQKWKTQITEHPGISGVTSPPTIARGKVYIGSFNFSGGPGALYCLDENTGSVLWRNETSSSIYFSSPALSDGRVYVGTMGLYDSSTLQWNEPFGVYCFDADSGNQIWYYPVNGSVGSSPTVTEANVLFTSKDGYLYNLHESTGLLVWKKDIGSSVSSPAVGGESIFVGSGDMGDTGRFYCINMSGNIEWEFIPNGAVQSSPAVDDEVVYFATNVRNGTVFCLHQGTGKLLWKYQPWPESYIISSPAISNLCVYIASDNGRLYCFDTDQLYLGFIREHTSDIFHVRENAQFIHHYREYFLSIDSMNSSSTTVKISSIEEAFDVQMNDVKIIDTDGDGEKDLGIILNNVNLSNQTASLTLYPYTEPEDEDAELNMVVVSILALFILGLVIMVVIILVARRVDNKTGAPEGGKRKKKDDD